MMCTTINQPPIQKHMLILDQLRAVAVLLVMGRHAPLSPMDNSLFATVTALWGAIGWIGVDLFFVLSGFLVAGLLFREVQITGLFDVRRFWLRRGMKIYPSFYLLIFITLVVQLSLHVPFSINPFISEVLFLQSYLPRMWNHTWTLAVEEHFYIILPILLLILIRADRIDRTPIACLCVIGLALFLRFMTAIAWPEYSNAVHLYPTHLRIDSLMIGVLLSYLYYFKRLQFYQFIERYQLLLFIIAGVCLSSAYFFPLGKSWVMHTIGFTLLSLGFGILLASGVVRWGSSHKESANVPVRIIGFIGRHSYSIYLWHVPIRIWGELSIGPWLTTSLGPISWWFAYLMLSIAVGIAMARLVEFPLLHLRDRVIPKIAIGVM